MKQYTNTQAALAAADLKNHAIIAFPTDTVYGVGVMLKDPKDLKRLKNIKKRPEEKPIPIMVSSLEMMEQIAVVNEKTRRIAKALLPGALTLILPVKEDLDPVFTNGKNTVALRIPDAPFVLEMIESLGAPMLVTSANISGEPAALTAQQAAEALPLADGVVLGDCRALQASTIVDCTQDPLVILRPGPVSLEQIQAVLAD